MTLAVGKSRSSTGAPIYWPGNLPPRGGVVCLHGSEGGFAGWNDLDCALLAANGFAAMAHSYSPATTHYAHPDIDDVSLEGTEAALLCLKQELASYLCGVGLFGSSRGAEHALLVAELLARESSPATPDAVAVHSPPDATGPAFLTADVKTGQLVDWDRPA